MYLMLHVLIIIYCVTECCLAVRSPSAQFGRLLLFAGLGLIHGVAPAMVQPEYLPLLFSSYSDDIRTEAAFYALFGIILFGFGWRMYESRRVLPTTLSPALTAWVYSPSTQYKLRRLFWICCVLGVVSWIGMALSTGASLSDFLRATRFTYRSAEGEYTRAMLGHVLVLACIPGFTGFFLPRRYKIAGTLYALGMAVFLYYAEKGSRMPTMGLLGSPLMGYALTHRLQPRRLMYVALAGIALIMLSVSMYNIRWVMMRSSVKDMLYMTVSKDTYQDALSRDPLNYHQYLLSSIYSFPREHPYLNGATYQRILFFLLPRQYFPLLKPQDTCQVFADVVHPSSELGAHMVPPSLLGDCYINFWGWPGIAMMSCYGVLFGFVWWKIRTRHIWLFFMGPYFIRFTLLLLRGQPYQSIVYSVTSFLMVWILMKILGCAKQAQAELVALPVAQELTPSTNILMK